MSDQFNVAPGRVANPEAWSPHLPLPPVEDYAIRDRQFMHDIDQLKALRSYMIRQAKSSEAGKIELGDLNLLRFELKGRYPTNAEWSAMEHHSHELYKHIADPDRRKFLHGQIPQVVVNTAGAFGLMALVALVAAAGLSLLIEARESRLLGLFLVFLFWVAALGAIGSIAFIGMNALAVQEDATFDLLNKKLVWLRVVLGALFAVVLTLPFGFRPFVAFIQELFSEAGVPSSELVPKSVLLLLPFILGFSTSLVIMILNQFVEAVQSFFGRRSSLPQPQQQQPQRPALTTSEVSTVQGASR